MLRGAKNTIQGAKMAFGTPFLAPCIGVALTLPIRINTTFFLLIFCGRGPVGCESCDEDR